MPELDEMTPSVELLRALLDLDVDAVDDTVRVSAVAGWERLISFCTAHQNDLLAAASRDFDAAEDADSPGSGSAVDAGRWWCEQVGLALGIGGGSAYHRMRQAVTLVDYAPAITAQLRVGAVTVQHARLAANSLRVLDRDVARAIDAAVVDDPDWRTPSQLERTLQTTILKLDPAGAKARHEARRRDRDVRVRSEPDGMCSLWALVTAEQGQVVGKTIEAYARSGHAHPAPGDHRTLAQRRADGLVDLITRKPGTPATAGAPAPDSAADTAGAADSAAGSGSAPRMHGQRPEIHVLVPWTTLMGLDDLPAFLDGYGPIGAEVARRIAHDDCAVWRRLLTDPVSGQLLDYGRSTYTPPRNLADFVLARDQFCRFPTCDQPAVACDIDHRHDWDNGCHTRSKCLDALCRRHHRLKHEGGWNHERDPNDNTSIWIDPAGKKHTKPATKLPAPPAAETDDPPPF